MKSIKVNTGNIQNQFSKICIKLFFAVVFVHDLKLKE